MATGIVQKLTQKQNALQRALRVAFVMIALMLGSIGSAWSVSTNIQGVEDCLSKLDPAVSKMILDAASNYPNIINDPAALTGFMGLLSQESDFRNLASGPSKDCPGQMVSFGYGQVNYSALRDIVNKRMNYVSKGKGHYCEDAAAGGAWLMAHPAEAMDIAALEYSTHLKKYGGNVDAALKRYCGGCDKNTPDYRALVQRRINNLSNCGRGDSGAPLEYNGEYTADGIDHSERPEKAFNCQDLNLIEALEAAGAYFNAASAVASRSAADAGAKTARENWNQVGNVFDSVSNRICFDMISRFDSLMETLMGIAGTIVNMLIGFINQMISLACQYVVAAITNVLSSICIPLPDLPSMPGFGGPDRKSCNGLSLADMVSISQRPPQLSASQLGVYEYQRAVKNKILDTVTRPFGSTQTSTPDDSSTDNSTRQ